MEPVAWFMNSLRTKGIDPYEAMKLVFTPFERGSEFVTNNFRLVKEPYELWNVNQFLRFYNKEPTYNHLWHVIDFFSGRIAAFLEVFLKRYYSLKVDSSIAIPVNSEQ
jgi:hypothetical protein